MTFLGFYLESVIQFSRWQSSVTDVFCETDAIWTLRREKKSVSLQKKRPKTS